MTRMGFSAPTSGFKGLDDVVVSLGLVGPAASFGVLAERSDVGELVAQDGQVFRIGGSPENRGLARRSRSKSRRT